MLRKKTNITNARLRSLFAALIFVFSVIAGSFVAPLALQSTASAVATTQEQCQALGDTWYPASATNYTASCAGPATCAIQGGIWNPVDKSCTTGYTQLSSKMAALGLDGRAKSYSYYKGVYQCIDEFLKTDSIKANIDTNGTDTLPTDGYWYGDGSSDPNKHRSGFWPFYSYAIAEVDFMGKADTGCAQLTIDALKFWGLGSPGDLLVALNYKYDGAKEAWSLPGGKKDLSKFTSYVEKAGFSTSLSSDVEYSLNLTAFTSFCQAKLLGSYDTQSTSRKQKIDSYNRYSGETPAQSKVTQINSDSTALILNAYEHYFGPDTSSIKESLYPIYADGSNSSAENSSSVRTCFSMVDTISNDAPAALNSIFAATCNAQGYTLTADVNACMAGLQFKNSADFCTLAYGDNAHLKGICEKSQGTAIVAPPATVDTGSTTAQQTTSNCALEGIGWVVCPVITFIASISDGAFSVISNFLKVNVTLLNMDSGTYTAWSAFRNIANVAFVIVFLFIIYSQLTGMGVSNYGVKKTLPRLVVTVILVNLSFFICQLAVDVTQILGNSINSFISAIPATSSGNAAHVKNWVDITGDVLKGGGIAALIIGGGAAAVAALGLSVSIPVLLAFAVAVLMTVVILIGRQAAIVILIVLSPLAFVAYLLPNTESWFKKWYKMFWGLLMVYPIVALLYSGGQLAARILANTAGSDFWLNLIAVGVSAIPLIMTPTILKGALNATGSIGTKLSGFAAKANNRVKGSAMTSSRLGEVRQGMKNRSALRRANFRSNNGLQKAIDQSSVGKYLGLDKGAARALRAIDQEEDSEVEAQISQIQHATNSVNRVDKAEEILKKAISSGDITTARAAQKILLGSGTFGLNKLQSIYSDKSVATTMMSDERRELTGYLRSELNAAGLKGKNNALARFGYEGTADALANGYTKTKPDGTTEKVSPFATDSGTFVKLNAVELAGQTIGNLESGRGHITKEAATAVLNNSSAAALLDDEKRKLFNDISKGVSAAADTTLEVDHGGHNTPPQDLNQNGQAPRTPNSDAGD